MKVAVVILNWNAADDTLRCVREILRWDRVEPRIWVVDNASADDSVEVITGHFSELNLVRNAYNQGFAGGTNRGIEQALNAGDDPVLLLNNDASIGQDDVVRLLMTLREDARIGLVGPLVFDAENRDRLLSAGGRNPVLHHLPRVLTVPDNRAVFPVGYVLGTAALVRAKVFRTVGLLDEAYFFIAELADLSRRAQEQGFLTVTDARARAYHVLGRSGHYRSSLYVYYTIRNRFLFIRKFYRGMRVPLVAFWGVYSVMLSLKLRVSGNRVSAQAVQLGLVDGLRGRFGGQNERVLNYLGV